VRLTCSHLQSRRSRKRETSKVQKGHQKIAQSLPFFAEALTVAEGEVEGTRALGKAENKITPGTEPPST
jgi:hypothetical protein